MGSENRATFTVTIATFNGKRFCDIKRQWCDIQQHVRHLAAL
jgi:hypothetical protein